MDLSHGSIRYLLDPRGVRVQAATQAEITGYQQGQSQTPPTVNPGYYHSAGYGDAYATASGGLACRDYSGQRIPCDKLFRDAANGYYSVLFVTTTGGMGGVGGETGGVMASLGLSATRVNGQYIGPRMIRREEKIRSETALTVYDDDGAITGFDGYTDAGDSLRVWYEPFGGLFVGQQSSARIYDADRVKKLAQELANLVTGNSDNARISIDAIKKNNKSGLMDEMIFCHAAIESGLTPYEVTGNRGELGLLQIKPHIARAVAKEIGEQPFTKLQLRDNTGLNVRLATSYLRSFLRGERSASNVREALRAYKQGPSAFKQMTVSSQEYADAVLGCFNILVNQKR
jgi:hypothetical protein